LRPSPPPHLLNILPTKTLGFSAGHTVLYGSLRSYEHLRVFGCRCYPNFSATAPHKLAPRSSLCVFLGYSPHHKGYCCLDWSSNRIIISSMSSLMRRPSPSPRIMVVPHPRT
jgi:histone deacetylase 1/2